MELYSMPQLDKTSVYPDHLQYDATGTPLVGAPVNKFGPVSLTSTAWSAIIHRPAEDSEPDELPSTVDMDAIKEPPTPLPVPVLTPKIEPPEASGGDCSSSGTDSDGDSSSGSGGQTNSDSEEGSGSGSWSESDSECGVNEKRATSSHSSDSDHSPHQNKQFSIRETNFDQGGLKLKISALKIPKTVVVKQERSSSSSSSDERDNSSSDEEADKSSDTSHGSPKVQRKPISEPIKQREVKPTTVKITTESPVKEKKDLFEDKKDVNKIINIKAVSSPTKATNCIKTVRDELRPVVRGSARLANIRNDEKSIKVPVKVNNRTSNSSRNTRSVKSVRPSSPSKLRSVRKKPKSVAEQVKSAKVISADSCDSDDEDEESDGQEGDGRSRRGDDITNLAHQLGEPETSISISEQLQVINQEDLAAILPDVVGFDGFEDVSSGEGKSKAGATARQGPGTVGQESSSDMELLPEQEQIVSEAIKRIDLDSEGQADEDDNRHQSSASGEDDQHDEVGYSSSLLQQFAEKTEQLTQKVHKISPTGSVELPPRRRRGRPPKNLAVKQQLAPANEHPNRLAMPELEAYMRLDCSVSNVSPDSGIQSVAGSPARQCSPAWHPPTTDTKLHLEKKTSKLYASPVDLLGEIGGKRGPGRPKGSGRRKRRRLLNTDILLNKEEFLHSREVLKVPPFYRHTPHHHNKTVVNMVEQTEELPRLPGIVSSKRGPGRPKKTPPTLELVLPLAKENTTTRVNKHSYHPISRIPKSFYEKGGPSGYSNSLSILDSTIHKESCLAATLDKRKKGRRKLVLRSRSLALSKGLMKGRQHRHKKKKKMKKHTIDSNFVMDIEELIQDFNKMCHINPETSNKSGDSATGLPSIFRVKRLVKKRKGSERERDSGPEIEAAKEKTPVYTSSTSSTTAQPLVKRRPKKSTVEATKNRDRPETNNEQRLPLKKRHYHLSATPAQLTEPAVPTRVVESTTDQSKSVVMSTSHNNDKAHATSSVVGKNDKGKMDAHRNSIDEAIEATITRYSHEPRPVIVTPKKRHRMELEKKGSNSSALVRNLSSGKSELGSVTTPQITKRVSSRSISTNNQLALPVAANPAELTRSRGPRQLSTSRTSSDPQPLSKRVKRVARAAVLTSATQAVLNKRAAARAANGKVPLDASLITPIPPSPTEINTSRPSRSRVTKPPAGVFEPSSKANELMNLVAMPPAHVNDVDSVLSQLTEKLKSIESPELRTKSLLKLDEAHNGRNRPKRLNDSSGDEDKRMKKKKVIRDIRVHVTKLMPSDLVLKKVMGVVKAKVRRRNRINRTGFPVKKKKKKKPLDIVTTEVVPLFPHIELEKPLASEVKITLPNNLTTPMVCVKKVDEVNLKVNDSKKMVNEFNCEQPADKVVKEHVERTTLDSRMKKPENMKLANTRITKKLEIAKVDDKIKNTETSSEVIIEPPKIELRKSSRRLMMLKARQRVEVSKRRKMKQNEINKRKLSVDQEVISREKMSPSPEHLPLSLVDIIPSEIKVLPLKRLRRHRDDIDRDDSDADSTRKKPHPRWRKKFLIAGLFSDCYKEDEPRKTQELCKSRLVYNPAEHKHGLLPPPYYCGKWVRQRRIPFQLPHDLWWLHTNNQLPGRDIVPSWNYKKIRTNIYYDVKPVLLYEAQACSCKIEDGANKSCGEDCINRMIYTECSPEQCPCQDKCSNQRIQRHEWAPGLEKYMTKDKGWGVKTKHAIKNGEFILEYVGEVVSEKEFKNRMASRYQHDTHHYCLNLDGGLVIDGHRMGGDGRFVNHSCEPNCEMQKWSVNGLFRMALFALRDIQPHEELAYDYNFSLFNPAEGQKCKCGSKNCRGVIGGKSQRVAITSTCGVVGVEEKAVRKPRKSTRKRPEVQNKPVVTVVREPKELSQEAIVARLNHLLPLKPLAPQQRTFVMNSRIFLLRNLDKVKQLREKLKQAVRGGMVEIVSPPPIIPAGSTAPAVKQSDVFMSQLNALSTPRNIRTRRLAQAQDNPELTKTARLAHVFRHLYNAVAQAKEENGEPVATQLVTLPSKRKLPQYYQRVTDPVDLTGIEHNIVTGVYKTVESFDQEMCRLFTNNVRFYGRTSDIGIAATRLRKIYCIAKLNYVGQLKEILGEMLPPGFLPEQEDPGAEEEDVIRCICGMFRDEGLMIQCERCLVWQHCDCVKADTTVDKYLCERCAPRPVDYEIPLEIMPEYATEGQKHYMTLLRGNLQLRQGDTVYVLRDIPIEDTGSQNTPPAKHTYKTIKNLKYSDCDIFKIERLWKDDRGNRFAFGHHYLRPHETFHEPTRKFFHNELMRIPLYEVVPLDLIMGHCFVLDVNTYCKGQPVGADPQHIYICEYRVDKYARLFAKLAKPKSPPVCLKSYAFEKYDQRLKITRTYTPHGAVKGSSVSRGRGGRSAQDTPPTHSEDEEMPLARVRDTALASKRAQQKEALNRLLLRLLARLPNKQPLDLSYLLEPGRRHRKRPTILSP